MKYKSDTSLKHAISTSSNSKSVHGVIKLTTSAKNDDDPELMKALKVLHRDVELLIAAETGNDEKLESLIRNGCNVHYFDHIGRNALHLAVCSDNMRSIELLINAGIDVNIKDNIGMTALSICLMRRPSIKVLNMLFENGAKILPRLDPMDTGLFLQFVMMCTATAEDKEILRFLMEKGALINDPNAPGGRQALHFAAMSNNCELILALLDMGANISAQNHRGQTPKDVAASFKCYLAYNILNNIDADDAQQSHIL